MHAAYSRLLTLLTALLLSSSASAEEKPWIELFPRDNPLEAWQGKHEDWVEVGNVRVNPENMRQLLPVEGKGAWLNGVTKQARNLSTKASYTDLEAHVEFCISKGSNSGVKMMSRYEIQILDSYGVPEARLTGSDCGGVYPRGENKPRYHTIDKGVPPRVNATKPIGEWQTLDIVFQGPRFDKEGKKVSNARFLKVSLNGTVIHENIEQPYPTGAAWRLVKEVPSAPFLLQADHGPVAFRNVRIRPISIDPSKSEK